MEINLFLRVNKTASVFSGLNVNIFYSFSEIQYTKHNNITRHVNEKYLTVSVLNFIWENIIKKESQSKAVVRFLTDSQIIVYTSTFVPTFSLALITYVSKNNTIVSLFILCAHFHFIINHTNYKNEA